MAEGWWFSHLNLLLTGINSSRKHDTVLSTIQNGEVWKSVRPKYHRPVPQMIWTGTAPRIHPYTSWSFTPKIILVFARLKTFWFFSHVHNMLRYQKYALKKILLWIIPKLSSKILKLGKLKLKSYFYLCKEDRENFASGRFCCTAEFFESCAKRNRCPGNPFCHWLFKQLPSKILILIA